MNNLLRFCGICTMVATLVFATTSIASAQLQTKTVMVPPPLAQAPQSSQYYFGVTISLVRDYSGTSLFINSVTPGSPAQRAGLEPGDQIRTVNGVRFDSARDVFEAVRVMNNAVISRPNSSRVHTGNSNRRYTVIAPAPQSSAVARMIVRNVRNGFDVGVTVYPIGSSASGQTRKQTTTIYSGK